MKKLIVLALAATLGVVANAASVTWGANSVSLTANQADATKYTAFLIDNTYAGYASADAALAAIMKDGASADGVIKSLNGVLNNGNVAFSAAKSTLDAEPVTYAASQKIDLYMVILDGSTETAKNYMFAEKTGAAFNNSVNLTAAFGTQANNTWGAVPEPTSGLLMLVGLAGLALRRRRT